MKIVWEFKITDNMISHFDNNEGGLFFTELEDCIEQICANYKVEPWEMGADA